MAGQAARVSRSASLFETETGTGLKIMKTQFAASVLSALLYAQGLLGFAAVATILLKDHAHAEMRVEVPAAPVPAS